MSAPLIYLDGLASQPMLPAAKKALMEAMRHPGNANSVHRAGWRASELIETARHSVAGLIGASAEDIHFTSSASEANRQILLNLATHQYPVAERRALVISALEHDAVNGPAHSLAREGWDIRICRICSDGQIDLDHFSSLVDEHVAMASILFASNLTGSLQPIAEASAIAKNAGAVFHTDAAQAGGKTAIDVDALDVDYLTLSAHKFGGAQGLGALYRAPHAPALTTPDNGTGQTAGTPPTALIASMGAAADARLEMMDADQERCAALFALFETELEAQGAPIRPWARSGQQIAGAKAYLLDQGYSSDLITYLQNEICFSNASACFSGQLGMPPALGALHLTPNEQAGFFRLGLGWWVTENDVKAAARKIIQACKRVLLATGGGHQ